ncbi:MAG TPA: hypothetical protein EYQ07_00005, partial [Candidatus Poseidoniales archaeon]|nr:hypothetical protein [Candidatus Poseidoniales archaeon]
MSGRGAERKPADKVRGVVRKASTRASEIIDSVSQRENDTTSGVIRRSRNQFRRTMADMNFTGVLTKAPVVTIVACLLVTLFFLGESGVNDCRSKYDYDWCSEESSMNVNGDLEVYLPQGSDVSILLAKVQEDWTTNVMVIYVES